MTRTQFRKHVRLKGFDYTASYWYFVTICTDFRKALFEPRVSTKYGELLPKKYTHDVVAASYAANNKTDIVVKTLQRIENDYYENLEVDFYCIMPDHLHMIIAFHDYVKKKGAIRSRNYSLSDIVTAFKSLVSRQIGISVFQPNFYEHIIRDETSLDRIRRYILYNPLVEYQNIPWKKLDPEM